jgi:hypothetical protein
VNPHHQPIVLPDAVAAKNDAVDHSTWRPAARAIRGYPLDHAQTLAEAWHLATGVLWAEAAKLAHGLTGTAIAIGQATATHR